MIEGVFSRRRAVHLLAAAVFTVAGVMATAEAAEKVTIGALRFTSSSPLFIALMSTAPSKSMRTRLSKHFRRCGCTACGFFVCARISRSSSLLRK